MPFTAQELENISNAQLEHHLREDVKSQTLQNKPLLRAMNNRSKAFPAGKDFITVRVKGDYTTTIQGYSHDQQVTYQNPANIKQATYPYKRIHSGITVTLDELQRNGISITDTNTGKGESRHSGREMSALTDLLTDKLEDMTEGTERGMNNMYWRDGSQDSELVPGVTSFIVDNPTAALVVGGIDQSANTWWQNRAVTGINASTPSNQNLVDTLQSEFRQLRRYGNPNHIFLAGSDFIEALEQELRAKGNYTDTGWAKNGRIDASIADVAFKGVAIEYDPTLDDENKAKYGYVLDMKAIRPMHMEGERNKKHNPTRPYDRYVMYRAMTNVCGLITNQRNTSGVYSIS